MWIPAIAMTPRQTNGAQLGYAELATNKNVIRSLDFDASTQEYGQWEVRMPKSWDEGTFTSAAVWSHPTAVTNFGVVWSLAAVAKSNDDAGDVAFGTVQTMTDTGGTADDYYESPTSAAITAAGTPAAGDVVQFQVSRVVTDGSDTLAVDARLHGIMLFYTIDAVTDV